MKLGFGLGLKQKWDFFWFKPRVIEKLVCGIKLKVKLADPFGGGWYGEQHNHWPELEWIAEHGIAHGDCVIDCGANHGFTSIFFAKLTGSNGNVFAVEPLERNQKVIRENIELNQVTNCKPFAVAAGSSNTSINMEDVSNGSVLGGNKKSRRTIKVSQRRLDDMFDDKKIDFLKMDVEGFELEALKGATKTLLTKPRLALELHVMFYDEPTQTLEAILKLIDVERYKVFLQREVDGAIVSEPSDSAYLLREILRCEVAHLFCI